MLGNAVADIDSSAPLAHRIEGAKRPKLMRNRLASWAVVTAPFRSRFTVKGSATHEESHCRSA